MPSSRACSELRSVSIVATLAAASSCTERALPRAIVSGSQVFAAPSAIASVPRNSANDVSARPPTPPMSARGLRNRSTKSRPKARNKALAGLPVLTRIRL
jgi:hypothetical protein